MIPADVVLARAAALFVVSVADLLGPRRFARLAPARQAAAWALRAHGYTVVEIGELFDRDHTTICYHTKVAEKRAEADPAYAAQLRALMADPSAPAPPVPSRPPIALDDLAWRDWTTRRLLRRWGGFPCPATA